MSEMKKKEEARQTRTERELEALGEGTGSRNNKPAQPVKPKPKPKPQERRGTGRNDAQANFERLSAGLRKQIQTAEAAGNNTLAAKLKARLAELKKITEQAQ